MTKTENIVVGNTVSCKLKRVSKIKILILILIGILLADAFWFFVIRSHEEKDKLEPPVNKNITIELSETLFIAFPMFFDYMFMSNNIKVGEYAPAIAPRININDRTHFATKMNKNATIEILFQNLEYVYDPQNYNWDLIQDYIMPHPAPNSAELECIHFLFSMVCKQLGSLKYHKMSFSIVVPTDYPKVSKAFHLVKEGEFIEYYLLTFSSNSLSHTTYLEASLN